MIGLNTKNMMNNIPNGIKSLSPKNLPEHMAVQRQKALDKLEKFDTETPDVPKEQYEEKYKYTPVAKFFAEDDNVRKTCSSAENENLDFSEIDAVKIFMINGVYAGEDKITSDDGYIYGSLIKAASTMPETVQKYYNQISDEYDKIALTNTASAHNGLFVTVESGTIPRKPLLIIDITNTKTTEQERNLFVFAKACIANVIIYTTSSSDVAVFTNNLSEIAVEQDAQVNIVRIHDRDSLSRHFASDCCRQYAGSSLELTNIIVSGGLARQNTEVHLSEKHCNSNLFGLVTAADSQHIDNYTFIDHAAPECQSKELYKYILNDKALNIFNGRILVRPDAQKTLAFQSNKNILLSDEAKIHTKPQLEIYADDVKCSHGTTTGQLNEEALFYMQARGINKKTAEIMIMTGFANEILKKINNRQLEDKIRDKILKKF
jgi:Fe-S cluster assembly protein SufD